MTIPSKKTPLAGSERPRVAGTKLIGPLAPDELISVTLVIRPRPGSPPMPDLAHWQRTPLSKRRFLPPNEFAETYGAAQVDLDAVLAFVAAQGMTVLDSHAGRRNVTVQGTAGQMNAAFDIQLNRYEASLPAPLQRIRTSAEEEPTVATQIHHGYDGAVRLPTELSGIVTAVIGLDNRSFGGPGGSSGDPANSNPVEVPTIAKYYNFPNSGASDQTIGVIAPSQPPGVTNRGLSGYLANDINNLYFPGLTDANYRTKPASINDISLTVGTNIYSNNTTAVNISNVWALEATQDISTCATIAQGATINVYFTELTEQGLLVCLNRILLPEGEKQPTVVTCSYSFFGSDDSNSIGLISNTGSAAHQISTVFQQLALLGISVFVLAQDYGSDDNVKNGTTHVNYPGSDPWITCCGGTVVGNNGTGPEWVWSNVGSSTHVGGPNAGGASGGGASANFPIPAYQTAAGLTQIKDSNNNILKNRFLPDASGMVSYTGFFVNGSSYSFTGTSCATPLYAGLAAVLHSAFGVALGFLNPTLYQLGNTAFNDITKGNNDPSDGSNAPYFTAGTGWDACSGWGSIDGTKLLNGIAALMYTQTFYFAVDKNTYGLDEVGNVASYPTAFWLVLEGFTPATVSAAAPTLSGAFTTTNGVTITIGPAQPELPTQTSTPQRILYPCSVDFEAAAIKPVTQGGVFPAPGAQPIQKTLDATFTILGQTFHAETVFELVAGANPYFTNINSTEKNVYAFSQDLRVFTVTPGINNTPIVGAPNLSPSSNTSLDTNAGFQYIQNLLNYLNTNYSNQAGPDPFTTLFPDQTSALTSASSVTPSTIDPSNPGGAPFTNYNFAVARVRLNGSANSSSVKNVRVFFRLFVTQSCDTDYDPNSTYPSTPDSAGQPGGPLLGSGGVTIPFFATGNYTANSDFGGNADYTASSVNNHPIQIGSTGAVWAYYGCYLNVYPTNNTVNGKAVLAQLAGTHHCLVAQIAFDDAPIVNSNGTTESPENSDKLAQRNLQITLSNNPGSPATHRIPQTFDLRPSPVINSSTGQLLNYPDELMIDWGNTPIGSKASIYWPQVNASDVLALAKELHSTHQLSAADANTIQCIVPNGVTYVPIPPGKGQNFAGLFTVDLPPSVVQGQEFNITVRRIATRQFNRIQSTEHIAPEATAPVKKVFNWRYVIGTFGVRIPVTTAALMLPPEGDTLAIIKWRLGQMSPSNRWYPVLQRYISYLAARIDGLGGDATSIQPSPQGVPPSQIPVEKQRYYTGKVAGMIYDRFGDFEGFLLLTEEGQEYSFRSRESEIEMLIRFAWEDRVVITVVTEDCAPHCLASIILRPTPLHPRHWESQVAKRMESH